MPSPPWCGLLVFMLPRRPLPLLSADNIDALQVMCYTLAKIYNICSHQKARLIRVAFRLILVSFLGSADAGRSHCSMIFNTTSLGQNTLQR